MKKFIEPAWDSFLTASAFITSVSIGVVSMGLLIAITTSAVGIALAPAYGIVYAWNRWLGPWSHLGPITSTSNAMTVIMVLTVARYVIYRANRSKKE